MAIDILMPALSPTMDEGTLAKWLVQPGETITAGQVIAEIETDKATMEYEAAEDGTITELLVAEGTQGVAVNTPIARLAGDGAPAVAAAAPVPAPAVTVAPAVAPAVAPPPAPAPVAPQPPATGGRVFASPLARRLAADRGIDLGQIAGSGPGGRIIRADVETHQPVAAPTISAPVAPTATPAAPVTPAAPASGPTADQVARLYADRPYEEIALDGMRRTIAARLAEAKQTIPHFYLRRTVTLDPLLALREQLNAGLAGRGVKLSVNDFIIKACALALQQVPAANAVWAGDRILQLQPSDVAVAVAVEGGLFTPVIKDAHLQSLSALSATMKDLATRARSRKLAPTEYQGGAMAISNLGMYGIESFDAVINPPHGSILAVGAGRKQPVVAADGTLGVATQMGLTLSVDHRVIDGALGAEFLGAIVTNLEQPLAMLA